jgi:hypothetical protein
LKRFWILFLLALASFAFLHTALESVPVETVLFDPFISDAGLAWVQGNATSAFATLNVSVFSNVDARLLNHPVPGRVLLWDDSDQEGFVDFSNALTAIFSKEHVPFEKVSRLDEAGHTPGVLVLASSAFPAAFLDGARLAGLLNDGWVVVHLGLPFTFLLVNGTLVANENWQEQSDLLGFDFHSDDPLLGYQLTAKNASIRRFGIWQAASLNGTLVVFDRPLDLGFSSALNAADSVADLILNASYSVTLGRLFTNASGLSTLFFPPMALRGKAVLVHVASVNASYWLHVPLRMPLLRVLSPARVWANKSAILSVFSNASAPVNLDVDLMRDGLLLAHHDFGVLPAGVVMRSFSQNFSLPSGDYLLSFRSNGKPYSHTRVRVVVPTVQIRYADLASKTVYANAYLGDSPYSMQYVEFNGSLWRTDSQGAFRFMNPALSVGNNEFLFFMSENPVQARFQVTSGFLSSITDQLLVVVAVATFGFAFFIGGRRSRIVRVRPPRNPYAEKVMFEKSTLLPILLEKTLRLGRSKSPLSLVEATDALQYHLGDPQRRILELQAIQFFKKAAYQGVVYFENGFVTPCAWFSNKQKACQAVFERRFLDACTQSGFCVKSKKKGYRLTRGTLCLDVVLDAPMEKIRVKHKRKPLNLVAFRAFLSV